MGRKLLRLTAGLAATLLVTGCTTQMDYGLFTGELSEETGSTIMGSGSEYDPYRIWNYEQFKNIQTVSGTGKNFKLMQDITVTGKHSTITGTFMGTFDGNNKKISLASGINFQSQQNNGIFANVQNASFKNLFINYVDTSIAASLSTNNLDYNFGLLSAVASNVNYDGIHINASVAGTFTVQRIRMGMIAGSYTGTTGSLTNSSITFLADSGITWRPPVGIAESSAMRVFGGAFGNGNPTISSVNFLTSLQGNLALLGDTSNGYDGWKFGGLVGNMTNNISNVSGRVNVSINRRNPSNRPAADLASHHIYAGGIAGFMGATSRNLSISSSVVGGQLFRSDLYQTTNPMYNVRAFGGVVGFASIGSSYTASISNTASEVNFSQDYVDGANLKAYVNPIIGAHDNESNPPRNNAVYFRPSTYRSQGDIQWIYSSTFGNEATTSNMQSPGWYANTVSLSHDNFYIDSLGSGTTITVPLAKIKNINVGLEKNVLDRIDIYPSVSSVAELQDLVTKTVSITRNNTNIEHFTTDVSGFDNTTVGYKNALMTLKYGSQIVAKAPIGFQLNDTIEENYWLDSASEFSYNLTSLGGNVTIAKLSEYISKDIQVMMRSVKTTATITPDLSHIKTDDNGFVMTTDKASITTDTFKNPNNCDNINAPGNTNCGNKPAPTDKEEAPWTPPVAEEDFVQQFNNYINVSIYDSITGIRKTIRKEIVITDYQYQSTLTKTTFTSNSQEDLLAQLKANLTLNRRELDSEPFLPRTDFQIKFDKPLNKLKGTYLVRITISEEGRPVYMHIAQITVN